MRLYLDTSQVKFTVSKDPEPKMDNQTGVQKHASEAAWIARCITWREAVRNHLRGEAMERHQTAEQRSWLQRDREQQLYRQWQRIAYPMFDIPLDDDEAPEHPSAS
jgi:hypothetical protein